MATATPHRPSTLAVAARSTAALLLWSGGVLTLGALYGTEDLLLQFLVAVALLPFMWWHFIAGGEHNTPQSWTLTVHLLVMLAIPVATFGVRSWWLALAGQHVPDCVLSLVVEHEDGRGLRYEHDISCGDQVVDYTSRGEPIGQQGQALDMLLDPAGIIAAMPADSTPTWWSWVTPLSLAAVVTTVVVELVRTRRRTNVETTESVD